MAIEHTGDAEAVAPEAAVILVVEDDERTLKLERFVLEDEGFQVVSAGSGEEALILLPKANPALVLLDIGLPVMDGFATCGAIRETSRVPIIMVTAEGRDADKVRGLEAGADDYVTKPFSTTELAARVRAVLRRYNLSVQQPSGQATKTASTASHDLKNGPVIEGPNEGPAKNRKSKRTKKPKATDQLLMPAAAAAPPGDLFEGTVKLVVETAGDIRNMVEFVDGLRENPMFHLLRLKANQHKDGMDIWLRLRQPVQLKEILGGMKRVTSVKMVDAPIPEDDGEPAAVTGGNSETGAVARALAVSLT